MSRFDLVHLCGRVVAADDGRIDPRDPAVTGGHALIETLGVAGGRALLVDEHMARFAAAARAADFPALEPALFVRALDELLAASATDAAAARCLFSPGPPGGPPTRLVALRPLVPRPPEGLVLALERGGFAEPAGIDALKHTGRLARTVLAARARAAGADECLLVAADGRLLCATAANVVVVRSGLARTPPLQPGILPGVVRGLLVASGAVVEGALSLDDLAAADEVTLTSSLLGCWGVRRVLGHPRALPGSDGPVTRRLASLLAGRVP